jgi:hypothetical protein
MAKYLSDGTVLGAVYEKDGRFFYECEHCSTSFSGGDEYRLELKADQHDRENHQSTRD